MHNIKNLAELYEEETIQHRRWLHQHAELAWKEFETTKYIEEQLAKLGLTPQHIEGYTGCYAMIHGGQADDDCNTILLRADIDAMGGQDFKAVPYASIHNGAVHMCGHDAHTAMLLSAAKIIDNLQMIETCFNDPLNPAVVAIGSIHGGEIPNAYAGKVVLEGTIRTFSRDFQKSSLEMAQTIVRSCANLSGCRMEFEHTPLMPPVLHESKEFNELVDSSATKLYGESFVQDIPESLGSDDFAYFLEKVPGVYAMLGTGDTIPEHRYPLHDTRYDFDEKVLKRGVAMYVQVAVDYLNG